MTRSTAARRRNRDTRPPEDGHVESSTPPIELSLPDRTFLGNQAKTLFEQAEEREKQLRHEATTSPRASSDKRTSSSIIQPDIALKSGRDKDQVGPVSEAVFFALTLSMLHFTLDVLVHHQYRQEIGWDMIARRTGISFPCMFLLWWTPTTVMPNIV